MVESDPIKIGAILSLTRRLVLPTQSHWEIGIFMVTIITGHRVSNLRLVGPSKLHTILPTDFMVDSIEATMIKERKSSSTMVSQGT